jgi:type IV secretory pathway VirB10-like protein
VSSEPSSPGFIDPNARLLASVIPPAPPTLRARAARFITTRRSGDLRSVVRWSRSREGRACFLAALAGVALTLGFYRSESSSAASAGPAASHGRPSTALPASASVRSKPLALTPTATSASTAAAANETAALAPPALDDAADDVADDAAPAAALGDASEAVRPAPRKTASAKRKGKKASKHSRKAKRQSAARASSRGSRRAKSQRTTATGPLAAWLATQRSKEASSSKRR